MRALLLVTAAGALVGVALGTAAAGPPPPQLLRLAVTHQQPTPGLLFTGLAFTPVGGARITQVVCDARIGRKQLRGRQQRFYSEGVWGPAAVTCGWRIPAGTRGKRLYLSGQDGRAWVFLDQGTGQSTTVGTPVLHWQIKP